MRTLGLLTLLLAAQAAGFAQLTQDQKLGDFRQLVGLFDKRYAPYDWTKQTSHFDLLNVQPWLDRVAASQSDLDYYQICVEYVAGLNDINSQFILPSTFTAILGIQVAPLEGHLLITSVDRSLLPASTYPFDFGDELLSLDGTDAATWLKNLAVYAPGGTARAQQIRAASLIVTRQQAIMPHAPDVGDKATAVFRRITGNVETYSIPWTKTGIPLAVGPVTSPMAQGTRPRMDIRPEDNTPPSGQFAPPYRLPSGFVQRLGRSQSDAFLSGTFPAGNHTLGYLRIGNFTVTTGQELTQLDAEIAYFEQNTDGLVVDDWGTGGGNTCYAEDLAARFASQPFQTVNYRLRATRDWITVFEQRLSLAAALGAPPATLDQLRAQLDMVNAAYQNGGLTDPLPICGLTPAHAPASDRSGAPIGYTKPVVLLIDELTTPPGENFAAMVRDANRAILFGTPTAGFGTTNSVYSVGSYAESIVTVSTGLALRPASVDAAGFGITNVLENVGVYPDRSYDALTVANLATLGADYVSAFTQVLVNAIEGQ